MKKILVVDDDTDMLFLVRTFLEDEGYQTDTLADWRKVYDRVTDFRPDLVILDVQLPGMDGRLICRNLKQQEETRHIPIIVYSSQATAGPSAVVYGADHFIPKPFLIEYLLKHVRRLLS